MRCVEGSAESSEFIPRALGSHCRFLSSRVKWPDMYFVEAAHGRWGVWPGGQKTRSVLVMDLSGLNQVMAVGGNGMGQCSPGRSSFSSLLQSCLWPDD